MPRLIGMFNYYEWQSPARGNTNSSYSHLAANIGIRFYTPEEFFLKAETEEFDHGFDPALHLNMTESLEASELVTAPKKPSLSFTKNDPQELVIFCGSPGAGKSTFFWNVLQPLGYERVNQDILKTVRRP